MNSKIFVIRIIFYPKKGRRLLTLDNGEFQQNIEISKTDAEILLKNNYHDKEYIIAPHWLSLNDYITYTFKKK